MTYSGEGGVIFLLVKMVIITDLHIYLFKELMGGNENDVNYRKE